MNTTAILVALAAIIGQPTADVADAHDVFVQDCKQEAEV